MNEKKKEYLGYAIVILLVILLRTFIITPVMVNGTSMDTTLHDGDVMILSKVDYVFNDIERFDIVVIKRPNDKLIKRVIGMPGETIEIKDNKLYVDDVLVEQDFLDKDNLTQDFKETLKTCYFVMGDNRRDSLDSRSFGCVNKEEILGSANLVLFPFKNFGMKK